MNKIIFNFIFTFILSIPNSPLNPIQQRSLQAAQINMESFFCAMKMKLKKSWSQLANTISAFRGSSECPAQETRNIDLCSLHYYP